MLSWSPSACRSRGWDHPGDLTFWAAQSPSALPSLPRLILLLLPQQGSSVLPQRQRRAHILLKKRVFRVLLFPLQWNGLGSGAGWEPASSLSFSYSFLSCFLIFFLPSQ